MSLLLVYFATLVIFSTFPADAAQISVTVDREKFTEESAFKQESIDLSDLSDGLHIFVNGSLESVDGFTNTLWKLTDDLFVLKFTQNSPKYSYFFETEGPKFFMCDAILPGEDKKFVCVDPEYPNDEVEVGKVRRTDKNYKLDTDVNIGGLGGDTPSSVSDLISDHMGRTIQKELQVSELIAANDERSQEMLEAMAVVFFFFSVVCLLLINLTVMFVYYIIGNFKLCHCGFLWVFFTVMTIIMTFSDKSGVLGTLIWSIIMCVFIIVVIFWYCCCRDKRTKRHDIEMGDTTDFDAEDDENDNHDRDIVDEDKIDTVCCGIEAAYRPNSFTKSQLKFACCHVFWITLLLVVGLLTMYSFWQVDTYYVMDRETQLMREEMSKPVASKTIAIVYGIPGAASVLYMERFMTPWTKTCGTLYTAELDNNEEKKTEIQDNWITPYNVDMEMFDPSDYRDYDTVNDWFIRDLAAPRPIAESENPRVISSAADCRVVVFPNVQKDHKYWIKGNHFDMAEIIGKNHDVGNFEGGAMILFRLAPEDYHHFHNPLHNAQIIKSEMIEGTLHSVNADAMQSDNNAIENKRISAILDSEYGKCAFVMIGAVCVGSIEVTASKDEPLARGDKIGNFQFGGSTIAAFFEKGMIEIDSDLVERSQLGVETYIKQGQRIAIVK